MPDESLIAAIDPFDNMDGECARLYDFFSSLDAESWTKDTRCEGWTRREIVAHLAAGETYNRACLDDEVQALFEEGRKAGVTDMDSFNDWTIRIRADRSADEVLAEWRGANEHFRTEMRRRGRDGKVATSVGPYPVGWQAFHLASEYATHADDMDVPVPDPDRAGRLAWRLAFSKFALQEVEKPVEVESVDGTQTVRTAGRELTLSDHDFVEAVTARLKTIDDDWQQALRALA